MKLKELLEGIEMTEPQALAALKKAQLLKFNDPKRETMIKAAGEALKAVNPAKYTPEALNALVKQNNNRAMTR